MKLSEFSYTLPKAQIAQHPPQKRGSTKLLLLNRATGNITNNKYPDILEYLQPGDVLVLNNTKVIKARLEVLGGDGKKQELLLLENHGTINDKHHHKVMHRGGLVAGERLSLKDYDLTVEGIYEGGLALISSQYDIERLAEKYGTVPLPPYMKRSANKNDVVRYQTEFAKLSGSVAAPTASLNMTAELLDMIRKKGVKVCFITLHVGLGTFLPIRTDNIAKHKMHSEWFQIPLATQRVIQEAKSNHQRIVAVGTSVARTLEYASDKILLDHSKPISGEADIFIYPGYKFKLVDSLLTNFHAPKSTVLMLTAAFAGWDNLHAAYLYALENGYAFLSYGDSMLIF